MKFKIFALFVLAFSLFFSAVSVQAQEYDPPTVLIVGWDGFDYRSATQLAADGYLPNLSQFYVVPLLAWPTNSATKVGWSEIESGLGGDETKIRTNNNFNSKIQAAWTMYGIIRGNCPDCWLSTIHSKCGHTGDLLTNNGRAQSFYYLKSWALSGGMDRYVSCSTVGTTVNIKIEQARNYLLSHISAFRASGKTGGVIFAHFQDPDHVGHLYGMGSAQWNDYVVRLDQILGEAIAMLQPDVVFVVTDHGFNDWGLKGHSSAPYGVLASNLLLRTDGIRCDFTPTLLDVMGISAEGRTPPLLGKSLLIN